MTAAEIWEYFESIYVVSEKGAVVNTVFCQWQKNGKRLFIIIKIFGAFITDLSKAFDCISHYLILAKLNAYGLILPALRLMLSYLSNRKQKAKINSGFSSLGHLLFNIFIWDLFLLMNDEDFAIYADDNAPFFVDNDLDEVIFK